VAPPVGTLRVSRYFLALIAIFAVLYTLVLWPGHRYTPHLGLDLEGGTQVVFQAKTLDGKTPNKNSMEEARQIMSDRVNAYGVSNAEVVIQGEDQIAISIPGRDASAQIATIGRAAQLNFRPLIMPIIRTAKDAAAAAKVTDGQATPTPAAKPSGSPAAKSPAKSSGSASPSSNGTGTRSLDPQPIDPQPIASQGLHTNSLDAVPVGKNLPIGNKPTGNKPAVVTPPLAAASPAPTVPAAAPAATPEPAPKQLSDEANKFFSGTDPKTGDPLVDADPLKYLKGVLTIPTTDAEYNKLSAAQQQQLQLAAAHFDCNSATKDDKTVPVLLACDDHKNPKVVYLLGNVIVPGTEIADATANPPDASQGAGWTITLELKGSGEDAWSKYTTAHNTNGVSQNASITTCGQSSSIPCADFVAFVLDGIVASSPYNQSAINGQKTQISGNFDSKSANDLANQLRFGALPVNFGDPLTASNVSATLGNGQLKAGLLAGGIGLFLVVLYSLLYYRALGLVTIASLLVSAGLTYGSIVFLGRQIGFTLTLAGIAGFIVAVGITADSFVVFFERLKDEVHEGRSFRVGVPRAWVRARRTILSADTVSFLAALVLYLFSAGEVRGFAFTLGLSTLLDLVVVFLFTHPLVSVLARNASFGSAKFTGLNAVRQGGAEASIVEATVDEDKAAAVERAKSRARAAAADQPRASVGTIRLAKPTAKTAVVEAETDSAEAESSDGDPESSASDKDETS